MGRLRMPTVVMEQRNAFKNQAGRREKRALEPKVAKPFPDAPSPDALLTPEEVKAWLEISDHAPPGVLTRADPQLVELCARLLVQERNRTISVGERGTLIKVLNLLGMTPAGRASVQISVPVEDQASGFAQTG